MINITLPIVGKKERQLIKEVLDSRILASGEYVDLLRSFCVWNVSAGIEMEVICTHRNNESAQRNKVLSAGKQISEESLLVSKN